MFFTRFALRDTAVGASRYHPRLVSWISRTAVFSALYLSSSSFLPAQTPFFFELLPGSLQGNKDGRMRSAHTALLLFGLAVCVPRHHFGKYGTLADIALMKDKYTGHPRGFGFIKFEDLTGAVSGYF